MKCKHCRSTEQIEMHHVIPKADGGADDTIPLCRTCHLRWRHTAMRALAGGACLRHCRQAARSIGIAWRVRRDDKPSGTRQEDYPWTLEAIPKLFFLYARKVSVSANTALRKLPFLLLVALRSQTETK